MDRRSWPWKKKSSEKTTNATDSVVGSSNGTFVNQEEQDKLKNAVKYVQLSEERYAHLSGLEDQVKVLTDKLSTSQSEVTAKENSIKQHTKVAEEAVSGWEKAEAEALALKNQLESVMLLKLTAEERATHLDGALKECMKQIRNVKEESEQKLHDVVFAKSKQWEKVKFDLEARIDAFEQELLRSSAENDALSRSLQERSNMLMKISEEKSNADAEIEVLKTNVQSYEKEMSSLKYELHIVSKELEIRNEEKNMAVRSAEVANKQHLEDVKKITKLEAECQRLRGLVRKKLPGPAALAQMKMEVESLGREYGENRLRRSPAKSPSPHIISAPDFAYENIQHYQKENEFLTARLLAAEEETKMLKESLSKRNSELQASRNMFAGTASKLRSMETQLLVLNPPRNPSKSNLHTPIEALSHNESRPPSMTSMSEDGIDEEGSCAESWATALISELSNFKKEKDVDKSSKADSSCHLEFMDDFLEMERLACLSTESNGDISVLGSRNDKMRIENAGSALSANAPNDVKPPRENNLDVNLPADAASSNTGQPDNEVVSVKNEASLAKLQFKIDLLFETRGKDADMENLLNEIRCIVQNIQEELPQQSEICIPEEVLSVDVTCVQKHCHENLMETADRNSVIKIKPVITEILQKAINQIHDFVLSFGSSFDAQKFGEFSSAVTKVLSSELSVDDFLVSLSSILPEIKELDSRSFGDNGIEGGHISDCIDKVTLLENKVVQHEPGKDSFIEPSSNPEIVKGLHGPDFEMKAISGRYSSVELEELKKEKDNLEVDLARCLENLEHTKCQLSLTEQEVSDLKSQLTACQKSNSLTETQLKCMAESYRSLESRSQELESEISQLQTKAETLDNELQAERITHQEDLNKYKDLQEQMRRKETCSMCSIPPEADTEGKAKQEKDIAAAAEKLAECQETIFLLGRQLKALRPQSDQMISPDERPSFSDDIPEDIVGATGLNLQTVQDNVMETENAASTMRRSGGESPFDGYNSYFNQCDTEGLAPKSPINSKSQKYRSSRSSSSNPNDERHGRGFTRFFSKGKNSH